MKRTLQTLAAASLLLANLSPAHAAESLAARVASGLGQVIASQGNAAFQQIRDDLQQDLQRGFDQWMLEIILDDESETEPAAAAASVQ